MIDALPMTPDVRALITRAFPSEPRFARKKSFYVSTFPESGMNLASYWDGGSKDFYTVTELATGKHFEVASNHPYFEKDRPSYLKTLPPGYVVLRTGFFCGKISTPHVYLNPEDMPRYLKEETS